MKKGLAVAAAVLLAVALAALLLGVFGQDMKIGGIQAAGPTQFGSVKVDKVLAVDEVSYTSVGAQNLAPSATYYQLAPVTVLTLTLTTGSASDGDLLILHNIVATTTTVADTGATVGGGVITLGANDLAIFVYGNSKWIEVASPDNS